jgi:S-formylglutathione hydrolase
LRLKFLLPLSKVNLLGDPAEQSAAVYLPPSYDTSSAKRYPTLYLLHGFTANNKAWTGGGYQGMNLQSSMDEMIKGGKIREMIVVLPTGWNAYGGAFYTNSTVTGNWEDYIYRDLVQNIDTNYRTIARSESRGIAGHSMGGYGAVTLAMKHPDVFSAVYALSPCCLGMEGDLSSENPAWLKTIRLTSKEQLKAKPEALDQFFEIAFVAISAALSPNPDRSPFYVDFPYQEREGRLQKNESVLAKWRSKMPLYMVDENKENLLKLRGIFIDYGEKEEFSHIRITSRLFSNALAEHNVPHMFEVYEGGNHGNKIRERVETRLLQFFSDKLVFSTPN